MTAIETKEYYSGWYGCNILEIRSRQKPGTNSYGDRVARRSVWSVDNDGKPVEYRWDVGLLYLDGSSMMAGLGETRTRMAAQAFVEGKSVPRHARHLVDDEAYLRTNPKFLLLEFLFHNGETLEEAWASVNQLHPNPKHTNTEAE